MFMLGPMWELRSVIKSSKLKRKIIGWAEHPERDLTPPSTVTLLFSNLNSPVRHRRSVVMKSTLEMIKFQTGKRSGSERERGMVRMSRYAFFVIKVTSR